jgi:hypothetical protein
MMLYVRMALYFVFAGMAQMGLIDFNADTGTVSFTVDDLQLLIGGLAGYIGTFYASRVAKRKGGAT